MQAAGISIKTALSENSPFTEDRLLKSIKIEENSKNNHARIESGISTYKYLPLQALIMTILKYNGQDSQPKVIISELFNQTRKLSALNLRFLDEKEGKISENEIGRY